MDRNNPISFSITIWFKKQNREHLTYFGEIGYNKYKTTKKPQVLLMIIQNGTKGDKSRPKPNFKR